MQADSAVGPKHHAWPLPFTWVPALLETQATQWVLLDELQADLQSGTAALCSDFVTGTTFSI